MKNHSARLFILKLLANLLKYFPDRRLDHQIRTIIQGVADLLISTSLFPR